MKRLTFVFLTISLKLAAQSLTVDEIDRYCKEIKSKLDRKELNRFFYPNMSDCGGGLYGYYANDKLVYIDATYGGQFGYIRTNYFIKDSVYFKIIETNYQPSVSTDQYCKTHQTKNGDCDYGSMPYNKIVTTVIFTKDTIVTQLKNRRKVKLTDTKNVVRTLFKCGQSMQKELSQEKISR